MSPQTVSLVRPLRHRGISNHHRSVGIQLTLNSRYNTNTVIDGRKSQKIYVYIHNVYVIMYVYITINSSIIIVKRLIEYLLVQPERWKMWVSDETFNRAEPRLGTRHPRRRGRSFDTISFKSHIGISVNNKLINIKTRSYFTNFWKFPDGCQCFHEGLRKKTSNFFDIFTDTTMSRYIICRGFIYLFTY
jgi:hypothetical protein